jgi:protease-4
MSKSAKWALLGVGLLALSAIMVGVVVVLVLGGVRVPGNGVLVVRATGDLIDYDSRSPLQQMLGGEMDTLPEMVDCIERAAEDSRIKAIDLRVQGLEAGLARTQELRDALKHFRDVGKPILAYLETVGNRDYYLASVADEVYLMPGGMVMTTGLLADASFYRGTLDKLKIQPEMEHIGAYKSASEQWTRESMSDPQRFVTNSILDGLYAQFIDGIAASRKLAPGEVRAAVDKGMLTPEEARDAKLVDDLLYIDQVEDKLRKRVGAYSEIKIRNYKKASGSRWYGARIAVINANGAIVSGRSGSGAFGGEFIGSETLSHMLKEAREESGIRAVILRVDSPGGSGVASDAIWRETRLYRDAKRPLIVSMGDVAGSGGYYIAMAADAIVAEPATITGSIGVISGKFNMRGLYEDWLGIHRDQIKRGENADLFSDYTGYTDAQRATVRRQMESFYKDFVHKAAEGRGKKDQEIDLVGQGRIWTGEQALEIGLVDELGGLREAIEIAKRKAGIGAHDRVSIEMWPRRKGFFQSFSADEDVLTGHQIRLPAKLQSVLSAFEVRERIAADGPILWVGEF